MIEAALLVLAITVVVWPISALVRRHYRQSFRLTGASAVLYRLVRIAAVADVALAAGWLVLMSVIDKDVGLLNDPINPWLRALQVLGVIGIAGAVAGPGGSRARLERARPLLVGQARVLADCRGDRECGLGDHWPETRDRQPAILRRGLAVLRETMTVAAAAVLGTAALLGTAHAAPPADIDAYVAQSMQAFGAPGLSLSIVEDGRASLTKGYGVRRLNGADAVDEHTAFPIGSETKAFTAAALAILVDRKKLSWDDHVADKLPGFRMYDPYVSAHMTIRDLLTHRSGLSLGEGDLLVIPDTNRSRDDVVPRLALSQAGDRVPRDLRLRQHPLYRGGKARGGSLRRALGEIRHRQHLQAHRDGGRARGL